MSNFNGYDQWKTASPYDTECPEDTCYVCGYRFPADLEIEEGMPEHEGYCSTECKDGQEYWEELCAAGDPGTPIPKQWKPPCVRPMFQFLCDELQRGTGDGVDNCVERWSRSIYKGTACGAWLELTDAFTVSIGSIVEGVEQCAEVQYLSWPFTREQFWDAVQAVEDECDEIWKETHGCDDCGPEDDWTGFRAINPDCKTCNGGGTVI